MTALRDWRELAACRNTATVYYDPFFDETDKGERAAIAICRTCRVQGECLAYAVRTGQSYGVWGGRPQRELRRLIALDRLGRAQVQTSARHRNATKDRCEHGHRFDGRQHLLHADRGAALPHLPPGCGPCPRAAPPAGPATSPAGCRGAPRQAPGWWRPWLRC